MVGPRPSLVLPLVRHCVPQLPAVRGLLALGRFLSIATLAAPAPVVHAQPLPAVELLHAFRAAPANPAGGLARAADGSFYGLTAGVLYRVTPEGVLSVVHTFVGSAAGVGAPTVGPDGVVYGMLSRAGRVSVFRFEPATARFRILHTFDSARDGHAVPDMYGRLANSSLVFGPDGRLYGTTNGDRGITTTRHGSVFRVDPLTGTGVTLYEFSGASPALRNPAGGLVEIGGQLYGAAQFGGLPSTVNTSSGLGGIYRLDPATGGVTPVHLFSGASGRNPMVGLTRTSDGWLYGTAFGYVPPPSSTSLTHVFRFDPQVGGGALEVVIAQSGEAPSQLVEASDGHLYGVTEQNPRIFRVRRQPGGGHVLETVRDHGASDGSVAAREGLAIGLDGFLYGTALLEGVHRGGTIFRFDPLERGPAGDVLQFAVVHPFWQNTHDWQPSVPVRAPNGDLYGTTSRGGATLRGAVYRIDGATGALTLTALPGVLDPARVVRNSALVVGPDGLLYGMAAAPGLNVYDTSVIRVDPLSGVVSTSSLGARIGMTGPIGFTRGPDGGLYLIAEENALRFDPMTNGLVGVATLTPPSRGVQRPSRLVLGADGQLYLANVFEEPLGGAFPHRVLVQRLDPATGGFVTVADLGATFGGGTVPPPVVGTPVAAPSGTLLVPILGDLDRDYASYDPLVTVFEVTPATGAVRTACAGFALHTALGADGALYGVDGRLRRCDPATGVKVERPLLDAVGDAQDAPALLDGVLYGATTGGLYRGGTVFRLNPGGLPAVDTDGDGLPNAWESAYGLDPFRTDGDHGAAADPDGDGRTNAQELADGTHPRGVSTRSFAEGATGPFFRTRFDLANPNGGRTHVQLRFLTDTGARVTHEVVLDGGTHTAIDPASLAGLANATFSTIVEADAAIGVDRTMMWDPSGYGSHVETGVAAPAPTWYLAEGSTAGPFSLFYLLQNPQPAAVTATIRYLRPFGLPPIERTYLLAPHSRRTIVVDGEGPELASTDVSAVITAPAPIVVERAMYFSHPGQAFAAGHGSAGVTAPALEWFLAEGATGTFFDLFVLIANPNASAAAVEVEYLLVGGGSLTKTYTVGPHARATIWVDDEQVPAGSGVRPLANAALSLVVRATNGVPIVVERTMWWPGPALAADFWYEAHNSPGTTATATRWIVAGGEHAGPAGAQTFVLIANPSATAGRVRLTVLDAAGPHLLGDLELPAKSRTNAPIAPGAVRFADAFAVVIESLGPNPVPIVVERATYGSPGGVTWSRGGNALASPLP